MRQLAGTDAYHVLEETPAQHMHTMKIAVVDASRAGSPITFDRVRAWAATRLARITPFRWQLVPMPARLARPAWVDSPGLDLEYHVRHRVLDKPGSREQFDDAIADIASTPLNRSHPLWQLWFIGGLDGGRVAFAFKMHHAIADGGASVRILEEVFGAIEPTGAGDGRGDEREPTKSRLVAFAIRTQVKQWRQLPSMVARTLSSLRSGRAREKAGAAAVTRPLSGPSTRFNQPLTPNRAYVDVTVSMGELKAVKDALGATLNDVYIAICGGALRRYLQDRGELPSGDLTATSPVSLRGDDELHTYGNRISYWYVTLAPDDDDPVTRLRRVSERTSAARDFAQGDRGLFSDWQNFYVLFRFLSLTLLSMAERRMGKPAFNAIVSNVRGPRPLSFEGAPVVAVRSMGPIVGLEGLNFTAWSYGGNLSIGIHACREHAPDLRDLATHIRTELDTLTEAAKLLSTSS